MYYCTIWRGDNAHGKGNTRNRAFARCVHEPFSLKLFGQLGHLLAKSSLTSKLDAVNVEVELAGTSEYVELAR